MGVCMSLATLLGEKGLSGLLGCKAGAPLWDPLTPEPLSHVWASQDSNIHVPHFLGPQQAPQSGWGQGMWVAEEREARTGQQGSNWARSSSKARQPHSPHPAPRSQKGLLPLRFLFNHVSPLSIKAIFKVNYLLPSTANPTQLQPYQPQHHIMK